MTASRLRGRGAGQAPCPPSRDVHPLERRDSHVHNESTVCSRCGLGILRPTAHFATRPTAADAILPAACDQAAGPRALAAVMPRKGVAWVTEEATRRTDRPVVVLYDAACPVCCRFASWLEARDGQRQLELTPLQTPGALASRGIHLEDALTELHTVDAQGHVWRGADAVLVALLQLPGWRWLRWVWRIPGVRPVLRRGYRGFARIRPRHAMCETGSCACRTFQGTSPAPGMGAQEGHSPARDDNR